MEDSSQDMRGKEDDQRIQSVYLSVDLDTSAVHFGLSLNVPTHTDILRMVLEAGLVLQRRQVNYTNLPDYIQYIFGLSGVKSRLC